MTHRIRNAALSLAVLLSLETSASAESWPCNGGLNDKYPSCEDACKGGKNHTRKITDQETKLFLSVSADDTVCDDSKSEAYSEDLRNTLMAPYFVVQKVGNKIKEKQDAWAAEMAKNPPPKKQDDDEWITGWIPPSTRSF